MDNTKDVTLRFLADIKDVEKKLRKLEKDHGDKTAGKFADTITRRAGLNKKGRKSKNFVTDNQQLLRIAQNYIETNTPKKNNLFNSSIKTEKLLKAAKPFGKINAKTSMFAGLSKGMNENVEAATQEKQEPKFFSIFDKLKTKFGGIFDAKKMNAFNKKLKETTRESSKLAKLFDRIGSYSLYRVVRGIVTSLTKGFTEGVQNLYQFSKLTQSGGFAKSMDQFATSLLQIKNAIAVTFSPIITGVIVPLANKAANLLVSLSDKVSMFVARLKGQSYYLAVNTKYTKELAKAQRQLMSFDELNLLNASDNYEDMFVKKDLDPEETITGSYSKVFDIASTIKMKIENFEPDFEQIGGLIAGGVLITGLTKLLTQGSLGLSTGGVVGGLLTTTASALLTFGLTNFLFSDESEKATLEDKLSGIMDSLPWLAPIAGGLYGASLTYKFGGTGAVFGFFAGASITCGILDILFEKTNGVESKAKSSFEKAFETISWASAGFAGAAIGAKVGTLLGGNTVAGAAVGFVIGAALAIDILDIDFLGASSFSFDFAENSFTGKLRSKVEGIISKYNLNEPGYKSVLNLFSDTETKANGGFVPQGDLFIANEAGPELVGRIGNRTAVTNQDQFIVAMEGANAMVVEAIFQAVNSVNSTIANQPVPSIKIGDREIYQSAQRGQRINGRSLIQGV